MRDAGILQVPRPPAEKLKEYITHFYRTLKERFQVHERDNYYVIEQITTTRASYRNNILNKIAPFLYSMMTERQRPNPGFKLRNLIIIHKYYGSIDGVCMLYGRRNKLRLNCIGKPEAIEIAIDLYKPHVLATIYPPFQIHHCRDKEVIAYATSMHSDVFLCKLG